MISLRDALSGSRAAMEAVALHPIFDPTLVAEPKTGQLEVLVDVISRLRGALKDSSKRDHSTEEEYGAHLLLAVALIYRGRRSSRYKEAFDATSAATELYPLRADAHRLRGHIEFLRGLKRPARMSSALGHYERALRYDASDLVSRYCAVLSRQLPALREIEAAASLRERGKQLRAQELIDEAERSLARVLALWDEVLDDHGDLGPALLHRGTCLARLGELARAEADLDALCRLEVSLLPWCRERSSAMLAEAHLERARIRSAQGRYGVALEDLKTALELDPASSNTEVLRERAEVSFRAGDYEQAIEDCTCALGLEDDVSVLWLRARAYFETRRLDLARADASRLLRMDDEHVLARSLRGRCAAELGATQSALADFDRCLELRPRSAEVLAARATLHLTSGSPREALADAMAAYELGRDDPDVLYVLGCGQHWSGDEEGARATLKKASDAGSSAAALRLRAWYGIDL